MKKLIAMLLSVVMVVGLFAACGGNGDTNTTEGTTTAPVVNAPANALEVMENIWAKYGEEEKFAVIGGNMESPVDNAPGNYDMAYAENLSYNLLIPADQLSNVDQAATMVHMMNANTFTGGVVHLVDGADAAAFALTMRDAIQNNQWMCGFPETLVIAVFDGNYVLIAYGVNDAMNPFTTHLGEAYPEAEILYNEAVVA